MNIHTLQESEVQEAAALLLPMWVEHAKQAPELLDNSYIKNYDAVSYCRRAIKDPKQEIFVAEVNGKIVGIARVELQDAPGMYGGGQMAYFDDLVVHPDYRRQGIANKLIDSLKLDSSSAIKNAIVSNWITEPSRARCNVAMDSSCLTPIQIDDFAAKVTVH